MTTIYESDRHMLCLGCGEPGAHPLRLHDGRDVRACRACLLDGPLKAWIGGIPRGPVRFEPGSPEHDHLLEMEQKRRGDAST